MGFFFFLLRSGVGLCYFFFSIGFCEAKCYRNMLAGAGGDGESIRLCVVCIKGLGRGD